jgi:CubicO group peptidase (beta-lactamase class C family)
MPAAPLRFVIALAVAPIAVAAAAPTPLNLAMQKAAPGLRAGGFVLAESVHGEVQYATAGQPAPRAGIAPERVIFELGSISKVFTSLLLAQTVIEGKAALSDPIAKFLPADLALDPKVAAITLEQLASHTSGLPRLPSNLGTTVAADPYSNFTVPLLYEFLRQHHPAAAPPQPVEYSNLGGGLLGHVLERIHGKSYAALLAERISGPLGLADTVIDLDAEQQTRFAIPHSGSVRVLPWQFGALPGAGGIRSSAADLVQFGQALLSPTSPIHAAWELARQPHADSGANGDQVGLAIFFATVDGVTFYNHAGGTGGFRSMIEVTPATGRVVVLLLNNDAPEPAALVSATRGLKPAVAAIVDAREEVAVTAAQLADYPGVYAIDGPRRFTAVLDAAGRLRIRLTGQPYLPVLHLGHDRFLNPTYAAEFQFGRNAAGLVNSVTLHQRGHEMPAHRTAEPAPVVLFLSPDKLQEYPGIYQLAPNVVFEITTRSGHVLAKLTGQAALPVFCDRPDHFVYDVVEAALTFERNAAGAVTALVLDQNGRSPRAPRLPERKP